MVILAKNSDGKRAIKSHLKRYIGLGGWIALQWLIQKVTAGK